MIQITHLIYSLSHSVSIFLYAYFYQNWNCNWMLLEHWYNNFSFIHFFLFLLKSSNIQILFFYFYKLPANQLYINSELRIVITSIHLLFQIQFFVCFRLVSFSLIFFFNVRIQCLLQLQRYTETPNLLTMAKFRNHKNLINFIIFI